MSTGEGGGRRVAVVLGASGGIGAVVADHLTREGWDVVAHGNRSTPTSGVDQVTCDLTDWPATREMAAAIVGRHGAPELVVNCAGRRDDGLFATQSPQRWMAVVNDNVAVAHHPVRAFLPALLRARRGCVVQIASVAATVASPGQSAYSAAKAAVLAMTRTLAIEYGSRGVRFNAVAPGFVETAMTADVPDRVRLAIAERQALPGVVDPADVARVVSLLADAPAMTGQTITVDLGVSL